MKSLIYFVTISFVVFSCSQQPKPDIKIVESKTISNIEPQNLQTASFSISGMTCKMGCAATIEKNLNKLSGVQKAEVSFETQTAEVQFDPNVIGELGLVNAVSQTGSTYQVSNFQMDTESKKVCCKKEKKDLAR